MNGCSITTYALEARTKSMKAVSTAPWGHPRKTALGRWRVPLPPGMAYTEHAVRVSSTTLHMKRTGEMEA